MLVLPDIMSIWATPTTERNVVPEQVRRVLLTRLPIRMMADRHDIVQKREHAFNCCWPESVAM